MPKLFEPVLLSINICDQIIREERTHKTSLIGMFGNISATKFPCVHSSLHVHVVVTGGSGEQEAKLCFVSNESNKIIMELKGPIKFPDRVGLAEMNFAIKNLPLKAPGLYHFEFWVGEILIGQRHFNVMEHSPERK